MKSTLILAAFVFLGAASAASIPSAFHPAGASDSCVGRCNQHGVDPAYSCQCNPTCVKYKDCCSDYADVCSPKPAVSDAELKELSRKLHDDDVNGIRDILLNLQGHTSAGDSSDKAPQALFSNIPSDAFSGPTVKSLMALYDNYVADVSVNEVVTDEERREDDAFLDAVMDTSVMKQAHQFLVSKGRADADETHFKEYLRTVWFGMYSRSKHAVGSSGFEHVFVGEMKNGISGLHSWVRFASQELLGDINYLGYINDVQLGVESMLEMPMMWNGVYKAISSIAVAGSPELEMALGTVCFLTRPNGLCPLHGSNGNVYHYQTYELIYNGVTYVGTAYPTI